MSFRGEGSPIYYNMTDVDSGFDNSASQQVIGREREKIVGAYHAMLSGVEHTLEGGSGMLFLFPSHANTPLIIGGHRFTPDDHGVVHIRKNAFEDVWPQFSGQLRKLIGISAGEYDLEELLEKREQVKARANDSVTLFGHDFTREIIARGLYPGIDLRGKDRIREDGTLMVARGGVYKIINEQPHKIPIANLPVQLKDQFKNTPPINPDTTFMFSKILTTDEGVEMIFRENVASAIAAD